jgi:CubicO group peptidase (beta-lactamase class C family)
MLANGGELDGRRILSRELVHAFNVPRANSDEPDPVMFNMPLPISVGGFWLGGAHPPVCSVRNPRAICHPGQGGSIGWADFDANLAVAICHNRLFNATTVEEDALLPIADAVRDALHV